MDIIMSGLQADIFLIMVPKYVSRKIYNQVKSMCNSKVGMQTQFFVKWEKDKSAVNNLSVAKSILCQMVSKLGQTPWRVQLPYNLNHNGKRAMIVGADVFHMSGKNSVTSVVATTDIHFSETYAVNSI
jgi:hypothetical protein